MALCSRGIPSLRLSLLKWRNFNIVANFPFCLFLRQFCHLLVIPFLLSVLRIIYWHPVALLPPVLSLQHKFLLSYSRSISSAHKHLLFQAAHPFVFAESVCSPFLQERKRSRFCPGFVSLCWKCTTTTTTKPRVLEKNPSWAPTCILNELLAP